MSVVNKALFVIERNLYQDLTLDQIARYCGVSRFHLAHAFDESTGLSAMEYLRGRRLTEAAYALASGADDILSVPFGSRYSSHEAFSRAFKVQFGKTPEAVRKSESIEGLVLVDAIRHLESKAMKLKEPRFEKVGELLFIGLSEHMPYKDMQNIAGQWQRFMSAPYGEIEHKIAEPPVGITTGSNDDGIQYVCAAGVTKFGDIPEGCTKITLQPATYVVFAHDGHIIQIRETYEAIWNDWFPKSGKTPAEASSFERHNDSFDPRTGNGGATIWIPIRAGRALLDWSQEQLAEKAKVGLSTVRDYEKERRGGDVGGAKAIRLALEDHGVVFLSSEGNYGPGVRLVASMPNVLRRPTKLGRWDALMISIEWRGRQIEVFVSQEALDDLGHFRETRPEPEYIALFDEHRGRILRAAAAAIDAGRVTPDRRVHLISEDFPERGG